jgi:hypothetical protein
MVKGYLTSSKTFHTKPKVVMPVKETVSLCHSEALAEESLASNILHLSDSSLRSEWQI